MNLVTNNCIIYTGKYEVTFTNINNEYDVIKFEFECDGDPVEVAYGELEDKTSPYETYKLDLHEYL